MIDARSRPPARGFAFYTLTAFCRVARQRGRRWITLLLLVLLGGALAPQGAATETPPQLRWSSLETAPVLEAVGVSPALLRELQENARSDADWTRVLAVFAEPPAGTSAPEQKLPPMVGAWRVAEGRLRFEPRFPLTRGVRYRAELTLPGTAPIVTWMELPARAETPTTSVTHIYPSADVLPENQLKFYVQFSAPMSRGGVYPHAHLRDEAGREIELPFLELDEELWDPAMTRLTLLIDPGRIKRGVKPLEDIGPVFEAGQRYSLTLDAACRDAEGRPLRAAFVKTFRVDDADRTPPDPARWKIAAPRTGTRDALRLTFDEPLDHALALRLIGVMRALAPGGDTPVGGATRLSDQERTWSFTPTAAWTGGLHRVVVATTIEDLAGNNIGKTFDVDLESGAPRSLAAERATLEFEIE